MAYKYRQNIEAGMLASGYVTFNLKPDILAGEPLVAGDILTVEGQVYSREYPVIGLTFNWLDESLTYEYAIWANSNTPVTASKGTAKTFATTYTVPPKGWQYSPPGMRSMQGYILFDVNVRIAADDEAGCPTNPMDTPNKVSYVWEVASPVINSCAAADTNPLCEQFGSFVQDHSLLRFMTDITLDPFLPDLTIVSRTVTIGDKSWTPFADGEVLEGSGEFSGDVPYTYTVTDSRGGTASASGTLTFLPYAPPAVDSWSVERYATIMVETGEVIYELDDESATVWVNLDAHVTPLNGKNAYTAVVTAADYTKTIASGADGGAILMTQDRSAVPEEFSENTEWLFTLTLRDALESVQVQYRVAKSGAIFNIEKTGVAVGMRSSGTQLVPRFQIGYHLEILGGYVSPSGRVYDRYDTGWVPITLNSAACAAWSDSDIPEIRRVGSMCYLRGGIKLVSSLSATGTIRLGDIDWEFAPAQTRAQMAVWNDSTSWRNTSLQIPEREGVINLRNRSGSSISNTVYISLNSSYVID